MNKLKYLTLLLLLSVVACVRAQADPAAGDVGEVIVLNKADFLTKVFNYEKNPSKWTYEGDKPCIIDFYADWCGPCRRVAPVLQDLAKRYKDDIVIYKINVDKERELAGTFGVSSIPTIVFVPMKGERPTRVGVVGHFFFVRLPRSIARGADCVVDSLVGFRCRCSFGFGSSSLSGRCFSGLCSLCLSFGSRSGGGSFGLSLRLSRSYLSALLSQRLGLGLVYFGLCVEAGLDLSLRFLALSVLHLLQGQLLLREPCLKLLFGFRLVKGALLNALQEVLLEAYPLAREDHACRVSGLCTYLQPIQSSIEIQIYCGRISVGVVRTDPLNKLSISWSPAVCDYDLIKGVALTAESLQSDLCCHV